MSSIVVLFCGMYLFGCMFNFVYMLYDIIKYRNDYYRYHYFDNLTFTILSITWVLGSFPLFLFYLWDTNRSK